MSFASARWTAHAARMGLSLTLVMLGAGLASAATIHTNISPAWTRPASAAAAAAAHTTYQEWDGFAVTGASNQPTGPSFFGPSLAVPTAGDSNSAVSSSFIIPNGTANNAYYSSASVGDIYSPTGVVTPQITVPGYNISGNQLSVLVQAESWGGEIDPTLLTVNGVLASTLPNYSVTQTYTDGGLQTGFGLAFRDDYAWKFTLPADVASLQFSFGWGGPSTAFISAVVDTHSVPEPASVLLAGFGAASMAVWAWRRKRAGMTDNAALKS